MSSAVSSPVSMSTLPSGVLSPMPMRPATAGNRLAPTTSQSASIPSATDAASQPTPLNASTSPAVGPAAFTSVTSSSARATVSALRAWNANGDVRSSVRGSSAPPFTRTPSQSGVPSKIIASSGATAPICREKMPPSTGTPGCISLQSGVPPASAA